MNDSPAPRPRLLSFFLPSRRARLRIAILAGAMLLLFLYGQLYTPGFDLGSLFDDLLGGGSWTPAPPVQVDAPEEVRARLAALVPPAQPSSHAWEQFLGPARNGQAGAAELLRSWPATGPKKLWSVAVGPGFGGASIRDGQVYVLDRQDDARELLRCFGLETGEELWQAGYDAPGRLSYNGSRSTPAVSERFVFTAGPFGHVACFDRSTHQLLWSDNLIEHGGRTPNWGYASSPLLVGDAVIFTALAADAGLIACAQQTGALLWKSEDVGTESYTSPALHVIDGRPLVLFLGGRGLMGFAPDSGQTLLRYGGFQPSLAIPAAAALGDGFFFLTGGYDCGSQLVHIGAGDGSADFEVSQLFRIDKEGAQLHQALSLGGQLYANFNRNENNRRPAGLVCLGLDGNLRWSTGRDPGIDRGPLLVVGDLLLVLGGDDGVLRLVDPGPEGYNELASAAVFEGLARRDNRVWAPMAFSEGKLVLRSQQSLLCLDLQNP